jgi:hypothetical protein
MKINSKKIKLEIFYFKKAMFEYRSGLKYLFNKYYFAPKIINSKKIFEKLINCVDLSVHILTCHRDMVMTIWSLASYYQNANLIGKLYIHNDGTLTNGDQSLLRSFFPSAIIVGTDEVNQNLKKIESFAEIGSFIKKNRKFILLKKLIEPFLVSEAKYRLVIDSDLVWFRNPIEIEEILLTDSNQSLMASNIAECPVTFNDGSKLSDFQAMLNSGIVLYKINNFNLAKLAEYFSKFNMENESLSHFIEQAGYAYCLQNIKILPSDKYTAKSYYTDQVIMRHYTSPRRPLFFVEGIKILKARIKL